MECAVVPLVLQGSVSTGFLSPRGREHRRTMLFVCLHTHILKSAVLISKATSFLVDVVVVVLTWMKTLGIHRTSRKLRIRMPLARVLLVDGVFYPTVYSY